MFDLPLTLFRLTSGLPKIDGGGAVDLTPLPLFSYCDTNILLLIRFWIALGVGRYLNNCTKIANF